MPRQLAYLSAAAAALLAIAWFTYYQLQRQPAIEANLALARQVSGEFGEELKAELLKALEQGDAVSAISVCKVTAPAIAERMSQQRGWEVGRTSLKLRNPANKPDAWERQVLLDFDARAAAGEDPAGIEFFHVFDKSGGRTLRYMKAIPAAPLCLTCHGASLSPDIEAALAENYPGDRARGYAPGDIRGAFTIAIPLPPAPAE